MCFWLLFACLCASAIMYVQGWVLHGRNYYINSRKRIKRNIRSHKNRCTLFLPAFLRHSDAMGKLRSQLLSEAAQAWDAACSKNINGKPRREKSSDAFFRFVFGACLWGDVDKNGMDWLVGQFSLNVLSVPLLAKNLCCEDMKLIVENLAIISRSILHLQEIHGGVRIEELLPTYSLLDIPVPAIVGLFGNIVSAFKLSSDREQASRTAFLRDVAPLLTALLRELPLSSMSSKSTVSWVNEGLTSKAVVLPEGVAEQGKGLLMDYCIRKIYSCALDGFSDDEAETAVQKLLRGKTEADAKMEKWDDDGAVLTAADMAAKDATTDAKKSVFGAGGFFGLGGKDDSGGVSSWAAKLSSLLGGGRGRGSRKSKAQKMHKGGAGGQGMLVNTSEMSREIAEGGRGGIALLSARMHGSERDGRGAEGGKAKSRTFDAGSIVTIAPLLCIILSRWGGTGGLNIVTRARLEEGVATITVEPEILGVLNVLSYSTCLLKILWAHLQAPSTKSEIDDLMNSREILSSCDFATGRWGRTMACISLFASLLSNTLTLTDDEEILEGSKPLPLFHLRRVILLFKRVLNKACRDRRDGEDNCFGIGLIRSCSKVMRDLVSS